MHLIDSFIPVISYVVSFRSAPDAARADYREVSGEIRSLIEQSQALSEAGGIAPEEFDQGRFMVCAWIDEALLASDWNQKQLWQREQLQRLYYSTTEAGVEAFDRLEALGARQRDVREVYSLCLSLGFKGRYIGEGDEFLLAQLKVSNLKLLMATPASIPSLEGLELFPEALAASPPAKQKPKPVSLVITPLIAMLVAAPLILFALLYLIYRYVLNGLVLPIH